MHFIPELEKRGRSTSGQTFPLVLLFILVLSLAGFSVYLNIKQGETVETFTKEIKDQETELRYAKDTIEKLTNQIKAQRDSFDDQLSTISTLKKEFNAFKTSLSEIQTSVTSNISSIKSDIVKSQKEALDAASGVDAKLTKVMDEIKKVKEMTTVAAPVSVIDVKLEPTPAQTKVDPKKTKELKK